jgi:cytochrome c oxidase cbb3-type subunit 2
MAKMAGNLYSKPILFTIVTAVAILVGSIVTVFYPMMTSQMHPKLEGLKPFTAFQLAGRDIYQREGCVYCHTQTVRPLKAEVMRYGEYSKAGEFAYDHPFLWGSKRTGPDLARIGGKYPDEWHYRHFENPRAFFAQSDMPAYGWLKDNKLDPSTVEAHMKGLDFPYTQDEIAGLKDKTELQALVAYIQVIGTAVKGKAAAAVVTPIKKERVPNPLAGDANAIARGEELYKKNCEVCHAREGKGDIGPSLQSKTFLYVAEDVPDDDYFDVINNGTHQGGSLDGRAEKGGMPGFSGTLSKDEIWSLVSYIRSLQKKT